MHRKNHKLRYKHGSSKHSSKLKHKRRKDNNLSTSILEPIQEISIEKVKVDKNACGDFAKNAVKVSIHNEKKHKHRRDNLAKKNDETVKNQNPLTTNPPENFEKSNNGKVRHHSLEKSATSLLSRTKNLFRREKSFNDSLGKVTNFTNEPPLNDVDKKEKKHKHKSKNPNEIPVKKSHDTNKRLKEKSTKEKKLKTDEREEQVSTKHKKKSKREKKSPTGESIIPGRVQEVIYCQIPQVPYILKHDKNNSEVKDLYQRIKRHKRSVENGNRKERSRSHGDAKKRSERYCQRKKESYNDEHLRNIKKRSGERHSHEKNISGDFRNTSKEKYMEKGSVSPYRDHSIACHKNHDDRKISRRKNEEKNKKEKEINYAKDLITSRQERSKSRNKHEDKLLYKDERHLKNMSLENANKERHIITKMRENISLKKGHEHDQNPHMLGPYEKYFAFDKTDQPKEVYQVNKEDTNISKRLRSLECLKKELNDQSYGSVKMGQKHRKVEKETVRNIDKYEEDKIHKIIEGDLKSYFNKIQSMIDQKLDLILKCNKTNDSNEHKHRHKHSRSKSHGKKEESKDQNKEEKSNKHKHQSREKKEDNNINKEDIIKEVLKRIKTEVRKHSKSRGRSKSKATKAPDEIKPKLKEKKHTNLGANMLDIRPEKPGSRQSLDKNIEKESCASSIDQAILYKANLKNKSISLEKLHRYRHKLVKDESLESRSLRKKRNESALESLRQKSSDKSRGSITSDLFVHNEYYTKHRSNERNDHPLHVERQMSPKSLRHTYQRINCANEEHSNHNNTRCLDYENFCENARRKSHKASKEIYCSKTYTKHIDPNSRPSTDLLVPPLNIITANKNLRAKRRSRSPHTNPIRYIALNPDSSSAYLLKKHYTTSASSCHINSAYEFSPPVEQQILRQKSEEDVYHRHASKVSKNERKKSSFESNQIYFDGGCRTSVDDQQIQSLNTLSSGQYVPGTQHDIRIVEDKSSHPRQEFVVQGIEPPSLESSKSKKPVRRRNLECKTVSIVVIQPNGKEINESLTNQTQATDNVGKISTLDRDLVEKRKQSKRFKLYYKYSVVDQKGGEDNVSSDARSIVSDSFRVIADPCEEEKKHQNIKEISEHGCYGEKHQIADHHMRKLYKESIPPECQLKNIVEESSNDTLKDQEYFIPIKSGNECYFRTLASSHSQYCFKIIRKPATSNISIQSKEHKYYLDTCKYCRQAHLSKSEVNISPRINEQRVHRSKSDVVIDSRNGKYIVKSIFLADNHPFVRSQKGQKKSTRDFKQEECIVSKCTECQTSDIVFDDSKSKIILENQQKQFKEIYKTIDNLEENITSSKMFLPVTVDIATSPANLSTDEINDKKPQFDQIYETINHLQDKIVYTNQTPLVKRVDVATGSTTKTHSQKTQKSRGEVRKELHDMAVGESLTTIERRRKLMRSRPGSKKKVLKSTGVSPVRIVEVNVKEEISEPKGPGSPRKALTPRAGDAKPKVTVQRKSVTIPDASPRRKTPNRLMAKKEPVPHGTIQPEVVIVQDKVQNILDEKVKAKHTDVLIKQPVKKRVQTQSARKQERSNSYEEQKEIHNKDNNKVIIPEPKKILKNKNVPVSSGLEDQKSIITTPARNEELNKKQSGKNNDKNFSKSGPEKVAMERKEACIHQSEQAQSVEPKDADVPASTVCPNSVTVNTALYKFEPAVKKAVVDVKSSSSSTSSSVSSAASQKARRSMSLEEIPTHKRLAVLRSKSDVCGSLGTELFRRNICSKEESILSGNLEKYTNKPKFKCQASKSNVRSLDQYMGRKLTSRLLLTKDYKGSEISSYQKRKLYDLSMRQKMKNKFKISKMNVGPQIFEVRFLSMVSQENLETNHGNLRTNLPFAFQKFARINKERSFYGKSYSSSEPNNSVSVNRKTGEVKEYKGDNSTDDADIGKMWKQVNPEDVDEVIKDYENNLNIVLLEDGSSNEFTAQKKKTVVVKCFEKDSKNKLFLALNDKNNPENTHGDIPDKENILNFYEKLLQLNNKVQITEDLCNNQCSCSTYREDCQSCKTFVNLVDILYNSMKNYCDPTVEKIKDLKSKNPPKEVVIKNVVLEENFENKDIQKNVEEIYPRALSRMSTNSIESSVQCESFYKNAAQCQSLLNATRAEEMSCLPQPISCPALGSNASSFEFLYEDTSSENEEMPRDLILANLTRPFDQTFNFSMSQYNVETPFLTSRLRSPTNSTESGYESIDSKSPSAKSINFFKKPNIAALFKPLDKKDSVGSKIFAVNEQNSKEVIYEDMVKSCQLYAKKVREHSSNNDGQSGNEYQEYSLAVLLGKNNSLVFASKTSSEQTIVEMTTINEDTTEINVEIMDELNVDLNNNDKMEAVQNSTDYGCQLVISNESLNISNVTFLDADFFTEPSTYIESKQQTEGRKESSTTFTENESLFTLDSILNNPFISPSKAKVAQKFFGELLKVYDKETEICRRLFKNEEFYRNTLVPALEERQKIERKSKSKKFCSFFKKRSNQGKTEGTKINRERETFLENETFSKLQQMACNARRCFNMFAEAVKQNDNIDDQIKVCGLLKQLEKIESGDFYIIKNSKDSNFEQELKSQVTEAFVNIYQLCQKEAKKCKRHLTVRDVDLIKAYIGKYKIGLLSKTDIVASYIGRGVIQEETQLKAAVTYLMHSQSPNVDIQEFEEHCKISKNLK